MAKLLLVDDEPIILDIYRRVLHEAGHETASVFNGADALKRAKAERFDLLVVDLNMPKMSGGELVGRLKESTLNDRCPVIVSSAFVNREIVEALGGDRRVHFLPKPFRPAQLVEKVGAALHPDPVPQTVPLAVLRPFINAVVQVFREMTGVELKPEKPHFKAHQERSGDISALVQIICPVLVGRVSLSFDTEHYLRIASRLFSTAFTAIDEHNRDAAAELLNIIFGQARRTLNVEDKMSIINDIPSVVTGEGHSLTPPTPDLPTLVMGFFSQEFRVRMEICSRP